MIRSVPTPIDADRPSLRSVIQGVKYARSRQELLDTYLIDLNAMFFGMPMALFPALAESFGGVSVGLFYAMPAVGSLMATLTSGWTKRVHKHGLAVTIAAAVWGLAIIAFGMADRLWLALLFLAMAGAADMVSGLFRMTIWNQTIPDHLRGRLAGIEMISYMTGPYLGNGEAGLVASLFGLRTSVISGGVLCVAGSGLLALLLPAFLRYDGREGLARKQAEEAERARNADKRRRLSEQRF
jgi:MFS family permease